MHKFFTLVSKEVRELLTPLVILPLIVTVVLFVGLGKIVSQENAKNKAPQPVYLLDLDRTETSQAVADTLGRTNFTVTLLTDQTEEAAVQKLRADDKPTLVVLPAGFSAGPTGPEPLKLPAYSNLRSFSQSTAQQQTALQAAVRIANEILSDRLIAASAPGSVPALLKNPVAPSEQVLVADRNAGVPLSQLLAFINSQVFFIPVILFVVIMFAAQMIATSIATEKENKTLETLLSTPVSRKQLVAAKLVAAGLVALLYAVVYMFAFRSYMDGLIGDAGSTNAAVSEAARQLGLVFGARDYTLLGLSLFFGILCSLAVAMILGTFAEDVKSAQGVIAPFSLLIAIPYILVMFIDLTHLSALGRWLIYAIPFSHPFLAPQFLWTHQYAAVVYGILYQLVVFLVFVYIASWIFSTDRIVTIKLNFSKRRGAVGR